jgi:predicted Fe-Mo cluster-binding NifX family protein
MLVAIPAETPDGLAATRSGHFGHAPWFTLVTIEGDKCTKVEALKNVDHDVAGCGGVIDFAISQGIDAIIVVGMGVPPFTRFTDAGIKVYVEQNQPYVGGAVTLFMRGALPEMQLDQACKH